jgi:hypothetical protein
MRNSTLRTVAAALIVLAVTPRSTYVQESNAAAQASAESWLALVDEQHYEDSWRAAATFFKNAVTAEKWQEAVRIARSPLGSMKSRTVRSVTSANTLPGAPDGEYVVFQFDTSFERKAAALETVTTIHEVDGQWRVAGYFVR